MPLVQLSILHCFTFFLVLAEGYTVIKCCRVAYRYLVAFNTRKLVIYSVCSLEVLFVELRLFDFVR